MREFNIGDKVITNNEWWMDKECMVVGYIIEKNYVAEPVYFLWMKTKYSSVWVKGLQIYCPKDDITYDLFDSKQIIRHHKTLKSIMRGKL